MLDLQLWMFHSMQYSDCDRKTKRLHCSLLCEIKLVWETWMDLHVAICTCHPCWLRDMAGPWTAEVQFGPVASIHGSIGSPSFVEPKQINTNPSNLWNCGDKVAHSLLASQWLLFWRTGNLQCKSLVYWLEFAWKMKSNFNNKSYICCFLHDIVLTANMTAMHSKNFSCICHARTCL